MADAVVAVELRGLALPASKTSPGGYFQAKTKYDVAWGDVLLALFIPAGSRLMRRTLGSDLQDLLFEPLDEVLDEQEVTFRIRDAIRQQAPHIRIENVRVRVTGTHDKTLEIEVTFSLLEDALTDTRRVFINKSFISTVARL